MLRKFTEEIHHEIEIRLMGYVRKNLSRLDVLDRLAELHFLLALSASAERREYTEMTAEAPSLPSSRKP